jgi:uncharacterized membrane protein YqjE
VAIGLIALGVAQLVLALWWLLQGQGEGGRLILLGVGGLVLGVLAVLAGIWKLRSRELD